MMKLLHIMILFSLLMLSCKQSQQKPEQGPEAELSSQVQQTTSSVLTQIRTMIADEQSLASVVRATGVIAYDPRLRNVMSARISGRLERLYVRYNFQQVERGQRILDIYSPEILSAQNELILVLNSLSPGETLLQASREKLLLLGLTNEQLHQIESSRLAINPLPVFAPYSGHVHDLGFTGSGVSSASSGPSMASMQSGSAAPAGDQQATESTSASQTSELNIKEGMYVQKGQSIFAIYSTDDVWALLNISQSDAALVKIGNDVTLLRESDTSNAVHSRIAYLEPIITRNISTTRARVYLSGAQTQSMAIGTLLSASIRTNEIQGMFVPRSAVVQLGRHGVVFVKEGALYVVRTVETGAGNDSLIQIKTGLKKGEEVAVNAQYLVDSESFVKEKNAN